MVRYTNTMKRRPAKAFVALSPPLLVAGCKAVSTGVMTVVFLPFIIIAAPSMIAYSGDNQGVQHAAFLDDTDLIVLYREGKVPAFIQTRP